MHALAGHNARTNTKDAAMYHLQRVTLVRVQVRQEEPSPHLLSNIR